MEKRTLTEDDLVVFRNILEMVIDTDREINDKERKELSDILEKVEDRIENMREEGVDKI